MSIAASIIPEFDNEMATTRRVIERVSDEKLGWKPHEKSMTMGHLAAHLGEMVAWTVPTISEDALDMNPPGEPPYQPPPANSMAEILATFDAHVIAARAAIAGVSDEDFMKNWSLLSGGQTLMTMPRVAVIRTFVMNHIIHHRGQLSVYLRLNDIPVPSIYGPSADESGM
jgi:uncharacterized damage-inducible protein DinB